MFDTTAHHDVIFTLGEETMIRDIANRMYLVDVRKRITAQDVDAYVDSLPVGRSNARRVELIKSFVWALVEDRQISDWD